jgi:NADH-quinone oxidoreductase subunit N
MNPLFLEYTVVLLGIILLMVEAFLPDLDKKKIALAGIAGLFFVLFLTWMPLHPLSIESAPFYTTDPLALFFKRFMIVMTIITLWMSLDFIPVIQRGIPGERPGAGVGEFFILPIFACASLMWLVSAISFIMLFVSLECMTVVLYISISYLRKDPKTLEAGTKYLILSALTTGFLVYGITWIFGITGTTSIEHLADSIALLPPQSLTPLLFGVGLVLVAFCFKIAAFPFQFWLPDVYQGAPTPITAFLSIASKAAGFVLLLRFLEQLYLIPTLGKKVFAVTTLLAMMTLLFGNLAAMAQTNMKRLLAYSSIAHTGYVLMAVASIGSALALPAIGFYLVAYLAMTSLAFIVLLIVTETSGGDEIYCFQGLHERSPLLAAAMTVAMISLAGLPLSAGFFGKFFIFQVTFQQGHYGLLGVGTISVVAGIYYYLKVIKVMYWKQPSQGSAPITLSKLTTVLISLLIAVILILGIYPTPILMSLQ